MEANILTNSNYFYSIGPEGFISKSLSIYPLCVEDWNLHLIPVLLPFGIPTSPGHDFNRLSPKYTVLYLIKFFSVTL